VSALWGQIQGFAHNHGPAEASVGAPGPRHPISSPSACQVRPRSMTRAARSWVAKGCIPSVREHTRASILANADARMGNPPEREVETALAEIAKIARLRLEDAL